MISEQTEHHLVEQLSIAIASDALPKDTRAWAKQVLERLTTPVHVGLLGPETCNLPRLANALLGADILPEGAGMPPTLLHHGSGDIITTVTACGARQEILPEDFRKLDPWSLAMAEFTAPLPLLEQLSLLLVPLEGGEQDVTGALNWAGQRCDMAIICALSEDEQARTLWKRLPPAFLDHGFLCLLRERSAAHDSLLDHPFRALFCVGQQAGDAAETRKLQNGLMAHVASARREDLEGTLLLLERYCPPDRKSWLRTAAPLRDERDRADFSALLDPPHPPDPQQGKTATPPAPTAEIISFLAAQADALAELCGTAQLGQSTPGVLALCTESIEACAEMAIEGEPEIAELFSEATDLVVLMQIESSLEAMTDAIALMLQLRHECEARLCA